VWCDAEHLSDLRIGKKDDKDDKDDENTAAGKFTVKCWNLPSMLINLGESTGSEAVRASRHDISMTFP